MSTRVLIADDHPVVRRGVRALLTSREDYEVVAEARNGREAVDLARSHMPTVILMDPSMPELNGADAATRIRSECPGAVVVALSMHSDKAVVNGMYAAGASVFLNKSIPSDDLVTKIRDTLAAG